MIFGLYLSIDGRYDAAFAAIVAEFAQVDALPGTEIQFPVRDGNGQAHSEQRAFGMGRHIVPAFHDMFIIRLVFLDDVVHDLVQVGAHIRIGILVDGQCAGSVLDKQVEQSGLWQWLGQMFHYFTGNQVATSPLGGQMKGGLLYHGSTGYR